MHQTNTYEADDQKVPDAYDLLLDEGRVERRNRKKRRIKDISYVSPWYFLGLVGQLGYSIALPIAGGAILGRVVDDKFGTYPRATLSLLLLGIVIAGIGFYTTIREVLGMHKRKNL
jgi:predicted F0F1-ATPase subunit